MRVITQRDAVRAVLTENPRLDYDEARDRIKLDHGITIPPPVFYSVRSEMGYGARRNGRTRISAETINQVATYVASTKTDPQQLLQIIEEMGFATFKECLRIVSKLETVNGR
jgi:hypothetical protein